MSKRSTRIIPTKAAVTRRKKAQESYTRPPVSADMNSIFADIANDPEYGTNYVPTPDQLKKYSFEQLYEFIYSGVSDPFNSSSFEKKREREFLKAIDRNPNVVESIYECPKCKYTRISVDSKQLRSGDEPPTNIFRCIKCGYGWKISK